MSEILDAARNASRVDPKTGNPLNEDGTIRIQGSPKEPFPRDFGPAEDGRPNNQIARILELQNKFYPYWNQTTYIDGEQIGPKGAGSAFHLRTVMEGSGVKVVWAGSPPEINAPNVSPVVRVLPLAAEQDMVLELPWPTLEKDNGQIGFNTTGFGSKKLTFRWKKLPKQPKARAGMLGKIDVAELPGATVISRESEVLVNGKVVAPRADRGSNVIHRFSVNEKDAPGAEFAIKDGDDLEVSLWTPGLVATGYASADVTVDFQLPASVQNLV